MAEKILFLEDDLLLGTLISKGLQNAGFEVQLINRLEELLAATQAFHPDLLVLDLEIAGRSSLEEAPALRGYYPLLPIIFASSHTNGKEIIACLNLGYTDYIKKPYEIEELIYYIRKWLPAATTTTLSFGRYQLNLQTRILTYIDQTEKTLNPKEFQLLYMLLMQQGVVVSRTDLLERVWNKQEAEESLNNYITYLRKHLSKDPQIIIRTIKGQGYMLICGEE